MARAKQTARSEARRRYRQASNQGDGVDAPLDDAGAADGRPAQSTTRPVQKAAPPPSGRVGFMAAARGAYHPAHIREDLGHLPKLLLSRAMLAAIGLVLAGGIIAFLFPGYTGSAFAWELLVLPGSALGPQLVAGFFAPRASYLLGFMVGIVQGVVFTIFLTLFASRLGSELPADKLGNLLTLSFVTGPISGTLFAAAAAWYRRFLALSSPRRSSAGRTPAGRTPAKPAPKRSTKR